MDGPERRKKQHLGKACMLTPVVVPTIALLVGIVVFFGYEIYKMIRK